MTPFKDGGAGTFIIDRVFKGVGRLKLASGTTNPTVFRRLNTMLSRLYDAGRLDILRGVRDKRYSPLEVHEFYQRHELDKLPTADTVAGLSKAWEAWAADLDCSDAHRRSLAQSLRHLKATDTHRVANLPSLVEAARKQLKAHPQSFRLLRSAAQAFVRDTLKRSHPLYREIAAVEPLKITPQRVKHPATPDELREITKDMDAAAADAVWTLATTGMRLNEYWGDWEDSFDRIIVHGTKTEGAERFVPRVQKPMQPSLTYKELRAALSEQSKGQMTPYDLRRTYANWLEGAGIPRTRRRLYLGHGNADVTDLYEWSDVAAFLATDAEKLRAYIAPKAKTGPALVKEES